MRPPRRHSRLLVALMVLGLGGFVALLGLGSRFPAHDDVLRLLAVAWFVVFGAARLLVHLDQAVGEADDALPRIARLRGRGEI